MSDSVHNLKCLYDNRIPCNIPELRVKLQNHFENYWLNECNNKPELCAYFKYKKSFCTEPYVKYLSRLQMSLLAQLLQEVSKKCTDSFDLNNQDQFTYLLTNEYKLLTQFVCTAWYTRPKLLYI